MKLLFLEGGRSTSNGNHFSHRSPFRCHGKFTMSTEISLGQHSSSRAMKEEKGLIYIVQMNYCFPIDDEITPYANL